MVNEWFLNIRDINKLLSKEELYDLFDRYKSGDNDARNKIIECNINLVLYRVSSYFINVNYDKCDLVSVGIIGLINAVDSYDISRGIEFTTYAIKCIDNSIYKFLRGLRKNMNVVSVDDPLFCNEIEFMINRLIDCDVEELCTDNITKIEEYRFVRGILGLLSKRDRDIVMLYFGFKDNKVYSQGEIARCLGLSQGYVSKLLVKNIKNIRNEFGVMD